MDKYWRFRTVCIIGGLVNFSWDRKSNEKNLLFFYLFPVILTRKITSFEIFIFAQICNVLTANVVFAGSKALNVTLSNPFQIYTKEDWTKRCLICNTIYRNVERRMTEEWRHHCLFSNSRFKGWWKLWPGVATCSIELNSSLRFIAHALNVFF